MGMAIAGRCFGHLSRLIFPVLLVLVVCGPAAAQPASPATSAPAKLKITIGKDTTYIDGPVNADGTVDYLAASNARQSQGVTAQNNAAIPLLKAFGPVLIGKAVREKTFKAMGIAPLPEEGQYYVTLSVFTKESNQAGDNRDAAIRKVWQTKDYPQVAAWLQANADSLRAVAEATKLPRFFIPSIGQREECPYMSAALPAFSSIRDAARALAARATLRSGQGDVLGARMDLITIHKLARLVAQHPMLISQLVAYSLEVHACDAEQAIVAGKIAAPDAKLLLADLAPLPPLPRLSRAFDFERQIDLDIVMGFARASFKGPKHMAHILLVASASLSGTAPPEEVRNDAPAPIFVDWDVLLRSVNQWFDRLTGAEGKPTFSARREDIAALYADVEKLRIAVGVRAQRAGRTYVGDLLGAKPEDRPRFSQEMADVSVTELFPEIGRASEIRDRAAQRLELAEVSLALAAYRAEKGQFPDALSALAPAYLKAVPKDLFTEGPLVYRKTAKGFLLYSLGPNMKDDGGKSMEEDPMNFDIPVKVE